MKLKLLFVLASLALCANARSAETSISKCRLTLKASKPSARSASIMGVSFSAKQLSALRSVCVVEIKHLTRAEKVALYNQKLEREEADIAAMRGE